jgi:hypothetical protein
MIVFAKDFLLDFTSGTNLGDLTTGGGINAAFDNDVTKTQANCANKAAATSGYAGRTLTSSGVATPYRAFCYGSSDAGYVSTINPSVTLDLYAKTGTAPASATDGTLIGTLTFTDTANESATLREIVLSIKDFAANHIWVRISQAGAANTIGIAQIIVYAVWTPVGDYISAIGAGGTLDNPVVLHDNIVTTSSVTTTTAEASNPATNLANPSTSLKWRGTSIIADEFITSTLSATADCFAIARHNFSSINATVSLEGRTVSDHQYIQLITPFIPDNDGPLMLRYESRSDLTSIRLKIASGESDVPEAAVVYCGQSLTLQRRFYVGHDPITMAREVNAVAAVSESGEFLGRIILGQYSASQIVLQNLTAAWVRTYLDQWLQDALETPFFFAWRPSTYPDETALAWIPSGAIPRPGNQRANGMMQITIPMQGITT